MLEIIQAFEEDQIGQVKGLSRTYIQWLIDTEDSLGLLYEPNGDDVYGYEEGEAQLPGEYVAPLGCLLLAKYDSRPAGCVALRQHHAGVSELRMLFVDPEFQGKGVGKALLGAIIDEARKLDYASIQLETANYMTDAHRLYRGFGFQDIPPYYDVQHSLKDILIFMSKSLTP